MPLLCVLMTADAHILQTWAGCTHARAREWAARHGYPLLLYPFVNDTWSIVRAVSWSQTAHPECDRTLYLDSDIVIRPDWRPETDARVDSSAAFQVTRLGSNPAAGLNTGAFFFGNDARARALVAWWLSYGNHTCAPKTVVPEQTCFQKAPRLFPDAIRVDNMSAPSPWHRTIHLFANPTNLTAIAHDMRACDAPLCHPAGIRFLCKRLPGRLGYHLAACNSAVRARLLCAADSQKKMATPTTHAPILLENSDDG
jgi:hypothetical protein